MNARYQIVVEFNSFSESDRTKTPFMTRNRWALDLIKGAWGDVTLSLQLSD